MLATKIDIKKTVMDTKERYLKEVDIVGIGTINPDEPLYPAMSVEQLKERTYVMREVYNPDTTPKKKLYLVNVDDMGIFNELLQISANDIGGIRAEEWHKGKMAGEYWGEMKTKKYISDLPWYKRLINRF